MYIFSPSNPHGSVASIDYLKNAILLARKYKFILAIDDVIVTSIELTGLNHYED